MDDPAAKGAVHRVQKRTDALRIGIIDEHLLREGQGLIATQVLFRHIVQWESILREKLLCLLAREACFLLIRGAIRDVEKLANSLLNSLELIFWVKSHFLLLVGKGIPETP